LRRFALIDRAAISEYGAAEMDLSSYSRQDLIKLQRQVERELEARRRVDQRTARQEVRSIAEKYGLSLAELVGGAGRRGAGGHGVTIYRHPSNPNLTWAGRGRKPNWVKEWEESGKSLDQLR
jgi:DNA-binding protein H-NS